MAWRRSFSSTVAIQLATLRHAWWIHRIDQQLPPGVKVETLEELPSSLTKQGSVRGSLTREAQLWKDRDISLGAEAGLFNKRVPVLRWADAVLNPSSYGLRPIRVLYSAGGNFLNQGANVTKNIRAFESVDFAVCHELFLTPTANYCDVVLPVSDAFEKEDIGIPWAGNYVLYKPEICRALPLHRLQFYSYPAYCKSYLYRREN